MPQILDPAVARAALETTYRDELAGGTIEIREETPTGTLIASIDLPSPAMGSATGTEETPGSRSISFLGLPYTATAVASSVNNSNNLVAVYRNSSGDLKFGPDLVTTTAAGTGQVLVSGTSGHAANSVKPVVATGNTLEVTAGVFTL